MKEVLPPYALRNHSIIVRVLRQIQILELVGRDLTLDPFKILDVVSQHKGELVVGGTALGLGNVQELLQQLLGQADGYGIVVLLCHTDQRLTLDFTVDSL